ncbi:MAG: zinc ABC transporter substrate-binding protein [Clostridia bacterium]|nr:zinc ABC transporter substrate-binding protein [Clostridia bacterium]
MKKQIALLLSIVFFTVALSACNVRHRGESEDAPFRIVTTIFPEYDWVRTILGDNPAGAEVSLLLDQGVDLHSYQPTAEVIRQIANCDLLVFVGGESDEWVKDVLDQNPDPHRQVINLMELIRERLQEEVTVEGMEPEEEDHDDDEEYDEHIWLSLNNAVALCRDLCEFIEEMDPKNATLYRQNTENYVRELNQLDSRYHSVVSASYVKTLVFGDRFPFRYLTEDYGLTYYAAFSGCSAETEASFATIQFLANKVDQLGLTHLCTIEGKDHRIAETVRKNTRDKNQIIVSFDSMQSVTRQEIDRGATYLSIMEDNLKTLEEALQ